MSLDDSPWFGAAEVTTIATTPLALQGWAGHFTHVSQSESDYCCGYLADLLQLLG